MLITQGPSFTVFDNGDIKGSFGSSTTNNSYTFVARAFCNYQGVTNSIQSSRQCTSVTDYGTGNFRFNWDTDARPHSNHGTHNYSWAGSARNNSLLFQALVLLLNFLCSIDVLYSCCNWYGWWCRFARVFL